MCSDKSPQNRVFHPVVHDLGGIIALSLIHEPSFKVRSVTIMNSRLWPLETEPQLKKQKWLVSAGILPFLYKYFNLSPKVLMNVGWGDKTKLTKDRHQYYMSRFPTPSLRSGPVGFLRALFDFRGACWQQHAVVDTL